ncbi:MAG: type II secretion system GspH family protein [Candidatus Muirbacterium halophilum]|nr:type II secretion system GspH family protein [Candidatus Muirbacterium halophilum]MCK9475734.1 type II secretion system GspH family protein [Candidatus Muirbacterium halophilum]
MTKKGFSLVELVIALGIVIIMTGAAALYLGDIYFKSQVAKSLGDMETIANSLLLHDTENGANLFETDLPGYVGTASWYKEKDTLRKLLGNYLAVLPSDPWGNTYKVNAYAGWVKTYASDFKIGGTSKYEKDITTYYLPDDLAVSKVRVQDNNANLKVDTNDTLMVFFTKSVRPNSTTVAVLNENPVASRRLITIGGLAGDDATGWFQYQDFIGSMPNGTETDLATGGPIVGAQYSRPNDSPFTYNIFSRSLNGNLAGIAGADDFLTVWKIGNEVYIPTGVFANGAVGGDNRGMAYVIWESTQGYLSGYKTVGEKNKLYLLKQAGETAKRTVTFRTLLD